MSDRQLTYNPAPNRPKLRLPRGACDTHCHVFGPAGVFPFAEGLRRPPGDAPKDKLFALHAMLGIERCVIVQSTVHGLDNAVVADALAAKRGTYLGVALVPTTVDVASLRRLDEAGFRGVRFNYMPHLGPAPPIEEVMALTGRLADLGWHLQIHMHHTLIADMAPALKRSPVPVVVDHMGRVDASLGLDQPGFRHLRDLLRDERFWVKVSACDRISAAGPPYDDAVPFARMLVAEHGDRALWGTDWPHPNHAGGPPDDGLLVDLIERIAPSERQRHALLVDNPRRLYRFDAGR